MPTVDVVDFNNQKVGTVDLADEVFGAEVNEALLYEAVRHTPPALRARHRIRPRPAHEVPGSGKKLWKQKGTGRARVGSVRSPIWRHGGTVHGPAAARLQLQAAAQDDVGALRSALSAKLRDGELKVVQSFALAGSQDQERDGHAGEARSGPQGAGRGQRREPEPGSRACAISRASRWWRAAKSILTICWATRRVLLSEAAARKLSEALAK